jgi:hypothetical protein
MAEEMSSVAVEAQESFTFEVMLLVMESNMPSLMQAHEASA